MTMMMTTTTIVMMMMIDRRSDAPGSSALPARPASAGLATLIAMADTDDVVRLRLLRAIRDDPARAADRGRVLWPISWSAAQVDSPRSTSVYHV